MFARSRTDCDELFRHVTGVRVLAAMRWLPFTVMPPSVAIVSRIVFQRLIAPLAEMTQCEPTFLQSGMRLDHGALKSHVADLAYWNAARLPHQFPAVLGVNNTNVPPRVVVFFPRQRYSRTQRSNRCKLRDRRLRQ
jgi:hypothetical protein